MPEVITKPVEVLAVEHEKLLSEYDELIFKFEELVNEINYGPDLNDRGQEFFDDLRNALSIMTATGRLLRDFPSKIHQ